MRRTLRNGLKYKLLLLVAAVLGCAGCARLPVERVLGGLDQPRKLSGVTPGSVFAPSPDGERVALVRQGVRLVDLKTERETGLGVEDPVDLVWSPDGSLVAAAFSREGQGRVKVFTARGKLVEEKALHSRPVRILWIAGQRPAVAVADLHVYSFGGNLRLYLSEWDALGREQQGDPLFDVTLKPVTLKRWGNKLFTALPFDVSPFGDEILFPVLHDPPEFPPYLSLKLRHLGTGATREVAEVPLTGTALCWPDGERVAFGDGRRLRLVNPWTGAESLRLATPGKSLAVSPGGDYLFADGRLYRDGKVLARVPGEAVARFMADDGLLVRHEGALYRFGGLSGRNPPELAFQSRQKLLQLRRWRSRGLISPAEYEEQKTRLAQ